MNICREYIEKIAIIENEQRHTYADLINDVQRIANYLNINNFKKVAIIESKGYFCYCFIWATYIAGSTFCCIDSSLSDNILTEYVELFDPDIIISSRVLLGKLTKTAKEIMVESMMYHAIIPQVSINSVLYVLFTSGSTGKPKGVAILRTAFEEVISWAAQHTHINSQDVIGQYCNISFDMGLCDVFLSLVAGATLVVLKGASKLLIGRSIKAYNINRIYSVPTLIDIFIKNKDFEKGNLSSITCLGFGGAPLYRKHMEYIKKHKPEIIVYNTYGPTETTLFTSCVVFTAKNYEAITKESVCLGQPIDEVVYNVTETGELEVVGNHCLAGVLDSNSCIDFYDQSSVLNYRTGDVVDIFDGEYYFRCRIDNQVKLRGNRIDLDGVDGFLNTRGLTSSAIVVHDFFAVFVTDASVSKKDIIYVLADYLSPNCMPDEIFYISELPMNSNGKYDKNKLKYLLELKMRENTNEKQM